MKPLAIRARSGYGQSIRSPEGLDDMFRFRRKVNEEFDNIAQKFAEIANSIEAREAGYRAEISSYRTEVANYRAEVEELKHKLTEAEWHIAHAGQTVAALKEGTEFLPPPPPHLQERVVGVYHPLFLDAGYTSAEDFENLLKKQNRTLGSCKKILDWGCGCGRVLRAIKNLHPDAQLFGTDVDEEAIDWLQRNYSSIATFKSNGPNPPIDLEAGQFDLIYGISVFTHLPEDMQFKWLDEVKRLLRPDGIAILSIHGPNTHAGQSEQGQSALRDKGFYYNEEAGLTDGLPEFYKNSYHTYSYIHEEWGRFFDIAAIEPLAIQGLQDAVVVKQKEG